MEKQAENFKALVEDSLKTSFRVHDENLVAPEKSNSFGISGDLTFDVNFDSSGNWSKCASFYCPINLSASARIAEGASGETYAVHFKSDHPQECDWQGLRVGDSRDFVLRTNVFSNTNIAVSIHCSLANSHARLVLHYNV